MDGSQTHTHTTQPFSAPAPIDVGAGIGGMLVFVAIVAAMFSPRGAHPAPRRALPPPVPQPQVPVDQKAKQEVLQEQEWDEEETFVIPTSVFDADDDATVVAPIDIESIGMVAKLRLALGKSRAALQGRFNALFAKPVDQALFDELEETLLLADVGFTTTERITESVKKAAATDASPDELRDVMRRSMREILAEVCQPMAAPKDHKPLVLLVVGVNGSGKTTTIGKLASRYKGKGKSVLLAAADTYRAAAVEQLKVWSERSKADFVHLHEGADPGAVVFQALEKAVGDGVDVVLIDTAGRLQTQKPLMEQLSKIRRVIQKHVPDGPHETLLVLDGTMGQNGLSQAKKFNDATPLTGVVVTKLDGTAKGGMVLTIGSELGLPVKFIGIGEKISDLRPFDADAFVEALT